MNNTSEKQGTLFSTNSNPLAEQIHLMKHQLDSKCSSYNVTFGIFKAKKGPVDHTSMVVFTDKNGKNHNGSFTAENMHHLVSQVNEYLETITLLPNENNTDSSNRAVHA